MADTETTMSAAALAMFDAGLCVVPTRSDGSKAPYGTWKRYMRVQPTRENVAEWFADGSRHDGFGVITGSISGNLEMLELEGRATSDGLGAKIYALADDCGLGDLWRQICDGYLEITPTGGMHILYRVEGAPVAGNTKLASNEANQPLVETRGEGGFTICAPSGGKVHPSGGAWFLAKGGAATIATITAEQRDHLHILARAFDETPPAEAYIPAERAAPASQDGLRPGDDYNERTSWSELLSPLGWVITGKDKSGVLYWRRPGKTVGLSATTGRGDVDNLYVFTTSTVFDAETPYSKFAALTLLEHGGDFGACARRLAADGYGDQLPELPSIADLRVKPAPIPEQRDAEATEATEATDEPSAWHVDLTWALNGEPPEMPQPTILRRTDGAAIFYPGLVNGIFGEPETAKSWIALCAGVEHLLSGGRLAYLDADLNGQAAIVTRLLALGVTPGIVSDPGRFILIEPHDTADLHRAMPELESWADDESLVIQDSLGELLPLLGAASESNDDVTTAMRFLTVGLVKAGAGIITIDHVPKNALGRNDSYAIGAQAKRRAIRGSYLSTRKITEVARGLVGKIGLAISKDTNGSLREVSADGAGIFTLDATDPARLAWSVQAGAGGSEKPTALMEKVSRLLESEGDLSQNAIRTGIDSKAVYVDAAVRVLIDEGNVATFRGSRGAIVHHLNAIYRAENEGLTATSSTSSHLVPTSSRKDDSVGPLRPVEGVSVGHATPRDEVRSSQKNMQNRNDLVPSDEAPQTISTSLLSTCDVCGVSTVTNPCKQCEEW